VEEHSETRRWSRDERLLRIFRIPACVKTGMTSEQIVGLRIIVNMWMNVCEKE